MNKSTENITPEENEVSRRVREIIEQSKHPLTDLEKRAQKIMAEAAASGAPESEMDRLCEGGAYEQAEAEIARRVQKWLDRK